MSFYRILLTIVLAILIRTAFGQYEVPLHTSANSAGQVTGDAYTLLSVTGQSLIGRTSGTEYRAYLGLLPPLRYALTDVQMNQLGLNQLFQNYPNPFRERTTIPFEMSGQGKVTLTLFNVMGQPVQILVNKKMPPGKHLIEFDAEDIAPGLFFYTIRIGDFVSAKSMVLTK